MKHPSRLVTEDHKTETELLGFNQPQKRLQGFPVSTSKNAGARGRSSKKRGAKPLDSDGSLAPVTYEQVDMFRGYMKQIGVSQLLAKEQEKILGERIRNGLSALLEHLLSSGFVADILLRQARTELKRKDCAPARKAALSDIVLRAELVLSKARERFASVHDGGVVFNLEVPATFRELIGVLNVWPGEGLNLLATLQAEFASNFSDLGAAGDPSVQKDFFRRHLMNFDACLSFLSDASRLCRSALAARNELVAANLRLVVSEARKMKHAFLSLEDLVQEGNIGLVTAAERFDERLGHKFSTFAVRLIRSAMRRENDNLGRTIRLPVHRCDALRKFEEACGRLESQLHRPASVQQLAEDTGFECAEVRELLVLKQGTLSLDEKVCAESDLTLEAFLPDPDSLKPFYGTHDSTGCLDAYAKQLTAAQREVVAYLYGMWGRPQLSAEETAEALSLGRVEVRQLHAAALNLLRVAISSDEGYFESVRAA